MKKSKRSTLTILAIAAVVALFSLWIAGEITRPGNSGHTEVAILSESSDVLLSRACFDCHSNHTTWPWYSRLPIVSLILNSSVREGRDELNFSAWQRLTGKTRYKALKESREEIVESEMPPWTYLLTHWDARLGAQARNALLLDIDRTMNSVRSETGKNGGGVFESHDDDDDDDD